MRHGGRDDFLEFMIEGMTFIEPFGDNSEFWVVSERTVGDTEQLRKTREAFRTHGAVFKSLMPEGSRSLSRFAHLERPYLGSQLISIAIWGGLAALQYFVVLTQGIRRISVRPTHIHDAGDRHAR